MNRNKYNQLRSIIALFVGFIVSIAVTKDSYLLAVAGVFTGMAFLFMVRSKAKIKADERDLAISEKAAKTTYAIFAPTIGIAAFLLLLPSKGNLSVFSHGEWQFLESLGMIFAYLSLFLIALYSISYHIFNRKLGGGSEQ